MKPLVIIKQSAISGLANLLTMKGEIVDRYSRQEWWQHLGDMETEYLRQASQFRHAYRIINGEIVPHEGYWRWGSLAENGDMIVVETKKSVLYEDSNK